MTLLPSDNSNTMGWPRLKASMQLLSFLSIDAAIEEIVDAVGMDPDLRMVTLPTFTHGGGFLSLGGELTTTVRYDPRLSQGIAQKRLEDIVEGATPIGVLEVVSLAPEITHEVVVPTVRETVESAQQAAENVTKALPSVAVIAVAAVILVLVFNARRLLGAK